MSLVKQDYETLRKARLASTIPFYDRLNNARILLCYLVRGTALRYTTKLNYASTSFASLTVESTAHKELREFNELVAIAFETLTLVGACKAGEKNITPYFPISEHVRNLQICTMEQVENIMFLLAYVSGNTVAKALSDMTALKKAFVEGSDELGKLGKMLSDNIGKIARGAEADMLCTILALDLNAIRSAGGSAGGSGTSGGAGGTPAPAMALMGGENPPPPYMGNAYSSEFWNSRGLW